MKKHLFVDLKIFALAKRKKNNIRLRSKLSDITLEKMK